MYNKKNKFNVTAIIAAAGNSTRMGMNISKQFIKIDGISVIAKSISAFENSSLINNITVVCRDTDKKSIEEEIKRYKFKKVSKIVKGSSSRQKSVFCGIKASEANTDFFAIHDGARAFIKTEDIDKVILSAFKFKASALAVQSKDTIKLVDNDSFIEYTPERSKLRIVQTPQVFEKELYIKAVNEAERHNKEYTDDCQLLEALGFKVKLVCGSYGNIKITTKEDIMEKSLKERHEDMYRIGHGYDVHKLVAERKLIIGGTKIDYPKGLLGHSDADVLSHAVIDALLGAAGLKDIGYHFPDTDAKYKDACSIDLLKEVCCKLFKSRYKIINLDATVIAQEPKIKPYISSMKKNLAEACCIDDSFVNIKATTEEGLGFSGKKEGICAHCVCLIKSF